MAFNYAHYAPPGAQILYTNPLFVRSHDFLGHAGHEPHLARHRDCTAPAGLRTRGGRLVGSLSALPYALAEAEQNFLIPAQTQALIWGDLVPQMILSAKIPRWWNVTPAQMHWVGLHMRYGRELLAEAALDPELRAAGGRYAVAACGAGAHQCRWRGCWKQGDVQGRCRRVTPSELFSIARDLAAKNRRTAPACWPS